MFCLHILKQKILISDLDKRPIFEIRTLFVLHVCGKLEHKYLNCFKSFRNVNNGAKFCTFCEKSGHDLNNCFIKQKEISINLSSLHRINVLQIFQQTISLVK